MKDIINYYLKSLSKSTLTLKKKGALIEKPWALIDDDGEMQKLIFKKNGELILSKNGLVSEGNWEYFPEAQSLLINRGYDKLLLKEMFIDESVIIMKKDGTDNEFFSFANENNLPDLNIPKYLMELRNEELRATEVKLFNGISIQVHRGRDIVGTYGYNGLTVEQIGENFTTIPLSNGNYVNENLTIRFYVNNGKITSVYNLLNKKLLDGSEFEIENGDAHTLSANLKSKVSKGGLPIYSSKIIDESNVVYELKESTIIDIRFLKKYLLVNGWEISVEQKKRNYISKGDKIIDANPVNPIPDGVYRRKKYVERLKITNMEIV